MAPRLDIADRVTLKVGEDLTVAAEGEGVGGYVWSAEVLAGTGSVRHDTAGDAAAPASIGGGASSSFTVRASAPGTLVLQFSLGRSWEAEPETVRVVTVDVVK